MRSIIYFCAAKKNRFFQKRPISTTVVDIMIPGVTSLIVSKKEKQDVQEFLDNHSEELEKAGLKDKIEKLLEPQTEYSKVRIGFKGVYLDHYDAEVRLSPLQMAILVYLIKHPDGVNPAWLEADKDELFDIYYRCTVADDKASVKSTISSFVSADSVARKMTEQVSRINRAFAETLDSLGVGFYAKQYEVTHGSFLYKINLQEKDVIWEPPFK